MSDLNELFKKETKQDDTAFMAPHIAAEYQKINRKVPFLLFATLAFIVIFITWANLAEVDEVARGEGKIIPSSQVKKISHLEGGIIETLFVREGDIVEKDQPLMRIDSTIANARYKEGLDTYYRYLASVERLKAQVEDREFVVPDKVLEKAPKVGEEEMTRYLARKEKLKNEVEIAQHEVEQKEQELKEQQGRSEQLKEELSISQQELALTAPLVDKGLFAKLDFLKMKRDASDLKGRFDATQTNVLRTKAALEQAKQKLEEVPLAIKNEDFNELREANNRLSNAQQSFTSEGDRASRTEIRSPVRGVIKQINNTTIGGIVRPGEDLFEIVPLEDTLMVEVKVQPSDIAFLHPGQKATIKITAYDYSLFGGLAGELVSISPDSIIDEKDQRRQSFYKVKIKTLSTRLSKTKEVKQLIPGMVVTADILTGKKTIMHYILKPIIKSKDVAFTER